MTRYDERMLSETKISYMYAPGSASLTFDVNGVRFGCLLGIEVHFPELFSEYERLSVDCVLFSTTGGAAGDEPIFATEAQGLAAANSYWVSFSVPARHAAIAPSGLIGPAGQWLSPRPAGRDSPRGGRRPGRHRGGRRDRRVPGAALAAHGPDRPLYQACRPRPPQHQPPPFLGHIP